MPDLNDMALFAQVVEARSFSAAARRVNASKSRVSKAVARLERSLGARLLNRSTRRFSLTEAGADFYRHCSAMLEEAAKAMQAVSAHHAAPQGIVKLSAPTAFGLLRVAPALPAFLAGHPALGVQLSLNDGAPDLVAGGHDVALVCAREPAERFVARRIAPVARVLCGSPAYFALRGVPRAPADLAEHNCLRATQPGSSLWRLRGPDGEVAVPVAGTLRADNELALWQAARAGLGIALLPQFLVEEDLASGRLRSALGAWRPLEEQLFALRMPGVHVAPKVRALIEFLCVRFGPAARPLARRPAIGAEVA